MNVRVGNYIDIEILKEILTFSPFNSSLWITEKKEQH